MLRAILWRRWSAVRSTSSADVITNRCHRAHCVVVRQTPRYRDRGHIGTANIRPSYVMDPDEPPDHLVVRGQYRQSRIHRTPPANHCHELAAARPRWVDHGTAMSGVRGRWIADVVLATRLPGRSAAVLAFLQADHALVVRTVTCQQKSLTGRPRTHYHAEPMIASIIGSISHWRNP